MSLTLGHQSSIGISDPLSPFGAVISAQLTPVVQMDGIYGLNTEEHETFTASGGSATVSSRLFTVSTGTSVGAYGVVRSKRVLRYRPGQGAIVRFTALYTTPVASSQQMAGAFNSEGGLFIGYNGTSFGVMRQYGGALEIQTLTLSVAASGTESVTVTLNGVGSTFNLASGTTAANAATIAAQSYTGWNAYQNDGKVIFVATAVGNKTNTFSFVNNTGGGTAAASFAETQAGAAHTEDWVYQTAFNVDKLDGTGPSAMTLDATKGNVYQISYQWLGFGNINFSIVNPKTGQFQVMHTFRYPNANTLASQNNPCYRIGWVAYSLGSTTNLTVQGASAAGFIAGTSASVRDSHSVTSSKTGISTTYTNLVSVRSAAVLNGRVNFGQIYPILCSIACEGTKPAEFAIFINATVSGTQNWTSAATHTAGEYDTTGTTVSGGTQIAGAALSKSGNDRLDLTRFGLALKLERTDVITLAIRATSGTTDATASISWVDD